MIKKPLIIFVMFFTVISLTFAIEKAKLPDYKEWPVFKFQNSYHYSTSAEGCDNFEKDDLNKTYSAASLTFYQYRNPDNNDFVDVIEGTDGKSWLIMYNNYLFQRKGRFIFFGHKWEHVDTLPQEVNKIIDFHLRNCLFFLTQ